MMKKKISMLLLICVLVTGICVPAAALDVAEPSNTPGNRAVVNGYIYLHIDGQGYNVPDTTYVGYGYTTSGYYVGVAQKALNAVNNRYANAGVPANCGVGTVDNQFGPLTYTGTCNFQTWVRNLGGRLVTDGIVGPSTWSELSYYLL